MGIWLLIILIYTPTPNFVMTLLASCLFIVSLYTMNDNTRGIALIAFSAPVLGALFSSLHIPLTAYFICLFLGMYFLRSTIRIKRDDLSLICKYLLLLLIFFASFLWGPKHQYSITKLLNITVIGFFSIIYWKSFINSSFIEIIKLAQFLCIIGLLYIAIAFDFFFFLHPKDIFDFDFFRYSFTLIKKEMTITLDYHSVGIPAMMGLALLCCFQDLRKLKENDIVVLIIALVFVLLIAQARQAMLGTVIIVIVRCLLNENLGILKKIWLVASICIGSYLLISYLNTEAFQKSMTATTISSAINRDYSNAIHIINNNFLIGKGLGGYSDNGMRAYPHNLLLEMLCELGFLGTVTVLVILLIPVLQKYKNTQLLSNSNYYVFPLLLALIIRSMMSSDLLENITALVAIIAVYNHNK